MNARDGHILALLMKQRSVESQEYLLSEIEDASAKEIAKGLVMYVNTGHLEGAEWVQKSVKHMMRFR